VEFHSFRGVLRRLFFHRMVHTAIQQVETCRVGLLGPGNAVPVNVKYYFTSPSTRHQELGCLARLIGSFRQRFERSYSSLEK
jgi:hypothetical protein